MSKLLGNGILLPSTSFSKLYSRPQSSSIQMITHVSSLLRHKSQKYHKVDVFCVDDMPWNLEEVWKFSRNLVLKLYFPVYIHRYWLFVPSITFFKSLEIQVGQLWCAASVQKEWKARFCEIEQTRGGLVKKTSRHKNGRCFQPFEQIWCTS